MATETTIDSVNIELASDASKATSSIDKLISSIEKIKVATSGAVSGLGGLDSAVKNITKSFSGMSGISSSFRNITGEAKTLKSTAKDLSNIQYADQSGKLTRQVNLIKEQNLAMQETQRIGSTPITFKISGIGQENAELQITQKQLNQIFQNLNLLIARLGEPKKEVGGIVGAAQNLNSVFSATGSIAKSIEKNFRPVVNAIKKGWDYAKKLAATIGNTTGIDRTLKKLSKYLFALFSIRGAYAAINTIATSWLSSASLAAQQLNVNIDYLKYALGSAVSPIIDYIANTIYSIAKVIQTLIYSLTGINIFAKAFAKDMKKASGSASSIKKDLSLAPFDELNVLSQPSSGGGSGSGGGLSPEWDLTEVDLTYNKWVEKLKAFFEPLVESWDNYGDSLVDKVKVTASKVGGAISAVWKSFENVITNGTVYKILEQILSIIGNIADAFKNAWNFDNNGTKIIQNLADSFSNLLKAIDNLTKSQKFQDWMKKIIAGFEKISEKLSKINWQPFIDFAAKIGGALGDAALWILERLVNVFAWIVEHPNVAIKILEIAAAIQIFKTITEAIDKVDKFKESLEKLNKINPEGIQIALGITLLITGITLAYGSIKNTLNGDLSSENLLKGIAGGALAGVGAGLLVSNPVGWTVGIGLIAVVTYTWVFKKDQELMKQFAASEGLEYDGMSLKQKLLYRADLSAQIMGLKEGNNPLVKEFKKMWNEVKTKTTIWIQETNEKVKKWFEELPGKVGNWLGEVLGKVTHFLFVELPQEYVKWRLQVEQNIMQFFQDALKWISENWQKIPQWLSELPGKMAEIGWNILQGLWNGLVDGWNSMTKGISDFITGFVDGFKKGWGINSPSTVFADIGKNIFQGLLNGLSGMWNTVKSKVTEWVSAIKDKFKFDNIKIKTPHISWQSGGISATGTLKKILETLNLPTSLPKLNVSWYAEGGMPDVGDLFFAGEAGPEWVGSLGNQTAVANQDQMTSVLKYAAYEGFTQALRENPQNNKTDVYIGNDKVYSGYGNYQRNQANKYGETVINV